MARIGSRLSNAQVIILGFAAMILLGALLLMLPISTADGKGAPFSDAVFTATSAVCVTGLVVQNTATYWSTFGHAVIIVLIQIGGMGIVTITVAIALISGKRISLRQRSAMQDSISAPNVGGIVKLTGFILTLTFIFEALGAAAMAPSFCREYGVGRGIWYAVFHSISAFCNAGFDLLGDKEPFSSLTSFHADPVVNIAIMALIIIGGIGFLVWDDVRVYKWRLRRYKMQSKVVLLVTLILVIAPALWFFFFEFDGEPFAERTLHSMFQSVTLRTAGFNTVDFSLLSEGGLAIMIVAMLIGGSPGSTAGGMKTTTAAVMVSSAMSVFKRRRDTHFFGRRIASETLRDAATLVTLYVLLFLSGGIAISTIEGLPLGDCLFETASAVGTVGLTMGITPTLGAVSRVILIALMYFGRVGGLTLIFAMSASSPKISKLPEERLTVG